MDIALKNSFFELICDSCTGNSKLCSVSSFFSPNYVMFPTTFFVKSRFVSLHHAVKNLHLQKERVAQKLRSQKL